MANYFAVPRVPDPCSPDNIVRMRRFFDVVGDIIDSLIRAGEITQTDAATWLLNLGAALTSDGSLTITGGTPTTIIINVGHTNTWTIQQVFNVASGNVRSDSIVVSDSSATTAPKASMIFQTLNSTDSTDRNWIIGTNLSAHGELDFIPSTTSSGLTPDTVVLRLGNNGGLGVGAIPKAYPSLTITNSGATGVTAAMNALAITSSLITLASGTTIATWLNAIFNAPTFLGVAGGPAETITNAATVYISAAPSAISNVTLSNAWALWVDSGSSRFDGSIDLGGGAVGTSVQVMHGGAAPAWGAVVLTTDVSGVLPVANGGTGATAFTAGSVVFAGASGVYTQDNTNFFWDNTNKRQGIGTAVPATKLHVKHTADDAVFKAESTNAGGYVGFAIKNGSREYSFQVRPDLFNAFGLRDETAGAARWYCDTSGTIHIVNDLVLGTALAIAYGGTGQVTANAAMNALAPSQGGHSGEFMTTNGTDTSWAAVGVAIGQAVGSGTDGSVLFVGAGPVLAQDNANLHWDPGSQFFGINTAATPLWPIHVCSIVAKASTASTVVAAFSSLASDTNPLMLQVKHENDGAGRLNIDLVATENGSVGSDIDINTDGAAGGMTVKYQGAVGFNLKTPAYTCDVNGNVNTPGTSGNTYRWGTNTSASGTAIITPDDWVLINVGGTDFKIPVYAV